LQSRVVLERSTIEAAAHGQPLLELRTVRLEKLTAVGLLGQLCPRLRVLDMSDNRLTALHGMSVSILLEVALPQRVRQPNCCLLHV